MPYIGLSYPIYAPIVSENDNAAPTYGEVIESAEAVSANLTWTRNSNPFFSNDVQSETDNGITGGSLTFGLNDLPEDIQVGVLGSDSPSDAEYFDDTDSPGPPCGFGYVRTLKRHGEVFYEGNWIFKAQFGSSDESTNTRGQNTEWQPPSVVGQIMGCMINNKVRFRRRQRFPALSAARAFTKAMASGTEG